MTDPKNPNNLSPDRYARLRAEARAPYRGLRQFVYASVGASAAIGAFVFGSRLLSGGGALGEVAANLALQLGILAGAIALFRWEQRVGQRAVEAERQQGDRRS